MRSRLFEPLRGSGKLFVAWNCPLACIAISLFWAPDWSRSGACRTTADAVVRCAAAKSSYLAKFSVELTMARPRPKHNRDEVRPCERSAFRCRRWCR